MSKLAERLLNQLGASAVLDLHAKLVGEVADILFGSTSMVGIQLSYHHLHAGAILHDIGKILHPNELTEPGNLHEVAGEALLIDAGISPRIARFCRSHAQWNSMPECSPEELVVALADHLWKGVRNPVLEERVIRLAVKDESDFWNRYIVLDEVFESIAAEAPLRLERSRAPGLALSR